MNRIPTRLLALAMLSAMAATAGCSNTPVLDRQFGQTARTTLRQQIIDPAAPASRSVAGVDGEAAKSAYDNYLKSYKDPVPQTGALSIGVGR